MICYSCGGAVRDKLTTYSVDIDGRVYIVKGVPSHVCTQCGAVSFSDDVMERLEKMIAGMRNDITEISMATYVAA